MTHVTVFVRACVIRTASSDCNSIAIKSPTIDVLRQQPVMGKSYTKSQMFREKLEASGVTMRWAGWVKSGGASAGAPEFRAIFFK